MGVGLPATGGNTQSLPPEPQQRDSAKSGPLTSLPFPLPVKESWGQSVEGSLLGRRDGAGSGSGGAKEEHLAKLSS